jgi:hypothetical protein
MQTYHFFIFILFLFTSCKSPKGSNPVISEPKHYLPTTDQERELLSAASKLNLGEETKINSGKINIYDSYFAASGRQCKSFSFHEAKTNQTSLRLICQFDGTWHFVPNILGESYQ